MKNINLNDYGNEFAKYFEKELMLYDFDNITIQDDFSIVNWGAPIDYFEKGGDASGGLSIFCGILPKDILDTEEEEKVLTDFIIYCMNNFAELNQPVLISGDTQIKFDAKVDDDYTFVRLYLGRRKTASPDRKVVFRAGFILYPR